jgi:transcriptional regulator with XRE-family HTH domain
MASVMLEAQGIRQRREALGLSQQERPQLAGLSIRTVVRLEHGENARAGTVCTILRIAEALETGQLRDNSARTQYQDATFQASPVDRTTEDANG